jgi:hypothetical protein
MTSNLKAILSAVGVAALIASPAMAKTKRQHQTAPSMISVPADAQASVNSLTPFVTPYSANLKVHANLATSVNPDFQLGGDK